METVFQDILSINGVYGLVLLSSDGKVVFESLDDSKFVPEKSTMTWKMILDSLDDFKEMDLLYDHGRFYLRNTENGTIIVCMDLTVSMAMIKLNCDIVVPELKKQTTKGLKRFFKF